MMRVPLPGILRGRVRDRPPGRNAMLDKTLACGEESTTTNRWEECDATQRVETENPFGSF
jgi:hypothetical protein